MTSQITRRMALKIGAVSIGAAMLPMQVTAQDDMAFIQAYTGHNARVNAVVYGDNLVYTGAFDEEIHKLNPTDMSQISTYTAHTDDVYTLEYGSVLYSASTDGEIHQINPSDMTQQNIYTGHTGVIYTLELDGNALYSGAADSEIHKINTSNLSQENTYTQHTGNIQALASNDSYLFSGATDNEIHKIDTSNMSQIDTYTGHSSSVQSIVVSGGYLYSGDFNGNIHKVNINDMSQEDTYTPLSDGVNTLALGADMMLYAGSGDDIEQINPSDMSHVDTYTEHDQTIEMIDYGADNFLYSASSDQEAHQIDPGTVVINPDEDLEFNARSFVVLGESIPYEIRFNDEGTWTDVSDDLDGISSSDTDIATIDEGNQVIQGEGRGETTITATYEGYDIEHSITVATVTIADLDLLPNFRRVEAIGSDAGFQSIGIATIGAAVISGFTRSGWAGVAMGTLILIVAWAAGGAPAGIAISAVLFIVLAAMLRLEMQT